MNLLTIFDNVMLTFELFIANVSIFILMESDLPRQGPVKKGSLLGIDVTTTTVLAASGVFVLQI